MASRVSLSGRNLSLLAIANSHSDVETGLRLRFSPLAPDYSARFFGMSRDEVDAELRAALDEADTNAILTLLAAVEAAFRVDFALRVQRRLKDKVSRSCRDLQKEKDRKGKRNRVSFEDEILEIWQVNDPAASAAVANVRSAFNYRHWLAHGRYWVPRLGRQYSYTLIYGICVAALGRVPLQTP